jgi:hypothetical protein
MDRAEERVLEVCPQLFVHYPNSTTETYDANLGHRRLYERAYRQAEKDLIKKAVTWWSNNLAESEPTKGHHISVFKKYMENK